tara:strand:- start:2181 stop:3140 length:960 start_codon:yes stop_codon:yes gene_type:complete
MENTQELLEIVHVDQTNFACNIEIKCPYQERSLSFALGVTIPIPTEDPEIAFKECCYTHLTLADLESSEDFKNDYSGFYHQRQLSNEIVSFFLYHFETDTEIELIDGTFGLNYGFGSFNENPNLKGFLVQWKKVLAEIGEGNFKIIKRQNIAGIDVEFNSIVFTLKQFSTRLADQTVRVDVVMNGRLIKTGVDFTGTSWRHSIRVPGFFGRREPGMEEDLLINRNYEKRQISIKQTNEWKFQTNLIPSCVTNEFWDFILMSNDIYMNDYNLNNHSYDFVKFGVKFASNDGTGYGVKTRKAKLNLTFNDKFQNNIKRNFR